MLNPNNHVTVLWYVDLVFMLL